MLIRNNRLYSAFMRSKRCESDIAALAYALSIASHAEENILDGIDIVTAITDALEWPKPPCGITPLMEKLVISFLRTTWRYGHTFGVIYDQTRRGNDDSHQHNQR